MKGFCLVALLAAAVLPSPSPGQQLFVLTDGTPLRVRLNRNVSSADAKIGETVHFDVVDDVLVNGAVVVQRGSTVLATVTEVQPKGLLGKAGKLNVSLDHARSILGEKIALRAVKENDRGGGGSIASIVTAPLMLFMRGKDATLTKGTEVMAYVHGDVRLDEARIRAHPFNASPAAATAPSTPVAGAGEQAAAPRPQTTTAQSAPPQPQAAPAQAAPAQAAPAQAAPAQAAPAQGTPVQAPRSSVMTNSDVLALKSAGFSDDLIVSKIKSSKCAFKLDTSDLIDLKTAGLSDRVIGTMMEKAQ